MKRLVFIISCVVLLGATFQSCKKSDQQIQNDVQQVLNNGYTSITSSVNDGIVTLTGMVDSQQERMSVENIARSVNDVRSVVNNITVRENTMMPAPSASANQDAAMMSTITSKLNRDGYHDVRVDVTNGEVILSGELNRNDLNKVMQIANESNPARVTNRINLK